MVAADYQSIYIEPQTTLRSKRAFGLRYTALNFNSPSVECYPPQELLNASPFFVIDGFGFVFTGTIGTNAAGMLVGLNNPQEVYLEGWITTRSPQAFHYQNLDLFCDWSNSPITSRLLQFYLIAGNAAADDFNSIVIWGYIEEPPRPTETPMRVAQDGWYSLKRRT